MLTIVIGSGGTLHTIALYVRTITRQVRLRFVFVFLVSCAFAHDAANSADNVWSNVSRNFRWDTLNGNWTNPTSWNNNNVDSAIFGTTEAGTISITTATVIARALRVDGAGYTIAGPGSLTLASGGGGSLAVGEIQTNQAAMISAIITGTVGLTKTGTDTLTLTGNNMYSGVTMISAGTLQIGIGGTSGSIAGNVVNNAALTFNRIDSPLFSDVISGSGMVTKLGAGTLTLSGDNTYTGGTVVSTGTLAVGNFGTAGSITGNVVNTANLAFQRSDDIAYVHVISGTGTVTKNGSGILTLTGANTYTGGTSINAGTLSIGNGGTIGSIVGNVTNSASMVFNRSDDTTFDGKISGTGSVAKQGTGRLILTGANTYTGTTTVSAGTLQIGSGDLGGSLLGNLQLAVDTDATFDNSLANPSTYAGTITGAGKLRKTGYGVLTLTGTGNNTYSGGTAIDGGTLQIGNGGISGNLPPATSITNNGTLVYNRSNSLTLSGVISGTGSLRKLGTGVLILGGENSYSGGTTIDAGTLQIGGGATGGSVMGDVINNAQLTFNRSSATSYGGAISGSGSVVKTGTGTLTVTGASTYTGGTTVNQGTLQIGDGGTTGSIIGNVSLTVGGNPGTKLIFNRSDDFSFGGVISGPGTVTKSGAGVLTLTGDILAATSISEGTLLIGAGNSTGSVGYVAFANNAVLKFDNSALNPLAHAGDTSGAGKVIKTGAGVLTLTGTFSHTGGTEIEGGTLRLTNSGGIIGAVTNNGMLDFNYSSDAYFDGVISGNGAVNKLGTNILTLRGENAHSGVTTIHAGTLSVGDGGTTGSIDADIANNANLTFNRSNATSYGGVISGPGTVTKTGGGTLTLTGENTYTGGTTITQGTVQLGNGATTGSIIGNVNFASGSGSRNLTFNRSDEITFGGAISGSGSVTKLGAGRLILTGTNTYTGLTTVSEGTLQVGSGNLGGGLSGNVTNNAVLNFDNSALNPLTYTNSIQGSGQLVKTGDGILTLTGFSNFYSGGTTISGGTLQIGSGGLLGSIPGNVTNEGTLSFNSNSGASFIFGGVISGAGALKKLGTNTVILTGENTYTGVTTISAGTLQLGAGGPTGSIVGHIVNNANLSFQRGGTGIYEGVISGSGSVSKSGGRLIFTGASTYSGGTTISSGTLQIGNGGTTGSILGNVANFGALWFNRSNDTTFGGVISGGGSVRKMGPGKLTLTGANTYTGDTIIDEGTLQIGNGGTSAAIVGSVTNNGTLTFANGILGGPGVINADLFFDITFGNVISGIGDVKMLGQSNLKFVAPNTYTGGTTVAAGVLRVSGSAATVGAGDVTVVMGGVLDIGSGVANAIADTATLSLAGGGTAGVADVAFADLGAGVIERVATLVLGGATQTNGLTYGSTLSSAVVQNNEFFAGTGIVSMGLSGDFNSDGSVDAADYVLWRRTGGTEAGYNIWRANIGRTLNSSVSTSNANTTVPEPATLVVLMIAAASWCFRQRRNG
jgi:autotransporter-associated beta strand protein